MPDTLTPQRFWTEFAVVTAAGIGLGAFGWLQLGSTWLDAGAVITALWYVYLAARERLACFPIGILGAILAGVAFGQRKLWGDAGLQGLYCLFMVYGWVHWGSPKTKEPLVVRRAARWEWAVALIFIPLATVGGYFWFQTIEGKAPFWDALTTSISLAAQWFQTRKVIENWPFWILVNVIYVPFYIATGLAIYAPVYAVFLVMAVFGWREWRESQQKLTATP